MITKKTMLDRVELDRSGSVSVRLALILDEDGAELHSAYHRVSVDFTGDVMEQMMPVMAHLSEQGYPPITQAAFDLLSQGQALILGYLTAIGRAPVAPGPITDLGHGGSGTVEPTHGAGDPGNDPEPVGV